MNTRTVIIATFMVLACAAEAQAQAKLRAATEAAEWLFARFGSKVGRSIPELANRIERVATRYGDEAIIAVRKGGPSACNLIEAAGPDGAKAVRVLAKYGEQGASQVLSKPAAMKQFLLYGDEAASVLVRHPGVAEPLVARAGAPAVKALAAVDPRNGRRLAMLIDGELSSVGRHPEMLEVVAKHGDRAANFIWQNKATLAGGAALAAFLANPEPFLNGTRDIAAVAGDSLVKPAVEGTVTVLKSVVIALGVLIVACAVLIHKHGLPDPGKVKTVLSIFRR